MSYFYNTRKQADINFVHTKIKIKKKQKNGKINFMGGNPRYKL